jgi:plasmid stabilization system protein ParE
MKVGFAQSALDDLLEYQTYLALQAGITFAASYVGKLEDYCETLAENPERGTQRLILGAAMRFIIFKGRVVIAYRIKDDAVVIMNFLVKGRGKIER